MVDNLEIRKSAPSDIPFIERLYPAAFPDEDLLPLVRELLGETPIVLSLVGVANQAVVGHVLFTICTIAGSAGEAALLGPLAVAPAWQKQGIGTAIVREGLERLETGGMNQAFVLGDPAYYGRFGFEPSSGVSPPYPLPAEWHDAWQSLSLSDEAPRASGQLCVPQPWRQRALWAT